MTTTLAFYAPSGPDYDLLTGDLTLRDQSWSPNVAKMEGSYRHVAFGAQANFAQYGVVVEQMDLVSEEGASSIRAAAVTIGEVLENARRFHADPAREEAQWLRYGTEGESPKRALLYEGSLRFLTMVGVDPLLSEGKALARVAFTRHPFWEDYQESLRTISTTSLSCSGGAWSLSSIPGRVPARIYRLEFKGDSAVGSPGPIETVWAGFRPEYQGLSAFEPVWECEDGVNDTDASDTADVGNASNDSKVQVSFSTETGLVRRMYHRVTDTGVSGTNLEHFAGKYLVLCRCKVSAGTIGLQMRTGYSSSVVSSVVPAEEIFLTNTVWELHELGEFQIPPFRRHEDQEREVLQYASVELWAERISGSGTLDLDCLILIPTRHFCKLHGAVIEYSGGDTRSAMMLTTCNDENYAYANYGGVPINNLEVTHQNWYLPFGNSKLILAAQRTDAEDPRHDLTDTLDLDLKYLGRYLNFNDT